MPVNLKFVANYEGHRIVCTDDNVSLLDLRFYVSDIALIDSNGSSHDVPLLRDERWQTKDVALIDLEDGQGTCSNGTKGTHSTIKGTVVDGDYVGLSFTVGVPFVLNHENPLLAQAPLNDAAMHWHWRSGYKFLRAGISTSSDGFFVHLGSAGCEGTVQNISRCRFPNRVSVVLPNFRSDSQNISVDLSAVIDGVNLTDNRKSDCSSGPSDDDCLSVFEALGLGFSTDGETRRQQVFRVSD